MNLFRSESKKDLSDIEERSRLNPFAFNPYDINCDGDINQAQYHMNVARCEGERALIVIDQRSRCLAIYTRYVLNVTCL